MQHPASAQVRAYPINAARPTRPYFTCQIVNAKGIELEPRAFCTALSQHREQASSKSHHHSPGFIAMLLSRKTKKNTGGWKPISR